ncbi:MAG: antibiotic biosynthesis monooxygenase [Burkholderiales bacterium]|nr:antibiotic biosynthesis monooxygenase [Burkholderiales bacterium]OJX09403.1 MAG: hypothetical protein BGO72_06555 [Burkholderiales bacterium 70-64]
MILRVVHAAVLPEKKQEFLNFVSDTLVPAVRNMPGCRFFYVAECVERCHEHEVIFINGWDTEAQAEAIEKADFYEGAASSATGFYTHRFHEGALHIHYRTIAGQA